MEIQLLDKDKIRLTPSWLLLLLSPPLSCGHTNHCNVDMFVASDNYCN